MRLGNIISKSKVVPQDKPRCRMYSVHQTVGNARPRIDRKPCHGAREVVPAFDRRVCAYQSVENRLNSTQSSATAFT